MSTIHRQGSLDCAAALFLVLLAGSAVASPRSFDLGSPEIVGVANGEAYLLFDLPEDFAGVVQGAVEEALLDLRAGWIPGTVTVEAVPFRVGQDSIPIGGMMRDETRARLVGRAVLSPRDGEAGRASISLRRMAIAISDSTWEGNALLVGLGGGSGPTRRWPAEAIEDLQSSPSGWSCQLRTFVGPAEPE